MIEQIEKNIFFKITRIFAWLIIVPACLLLLFSGYKSFKSLFPVSKITVTYDEVKSILEGKASYSDFERKKIKKSTKNDGYNYGKGINNLLDAFGSQINREEGEELFIGWLSNIHESDGRQFMDGLISVVKSAPEDKRPDAADHYKKLWDIKEKARNSEASSDAINKSLYLGFLGGSLSIISFFSLVLILLSIEKNTRKA